MKNKEVKQQVEVKKSKISGLGLFATKDIPWGMKIIEYTGEKISNKEYERRTKFYDKIGVNYLFDLDEKTTIDGLVGGNESRFINCSKENPNLCVIREKGKILFYSYGDIKKGDELTFDYGNDFIFKKYLT